jgi:hypothetical protein
MKKPIILLAAMLTFTTATFAQIGSSSSDLVFTPVSPCRILDTRLIGGGAGTPIPAGATVSYSAGGLSSFVASGGSPTDCGITAGLNVAAVAINFVVVSPSAAGYITVFPSGGTQPTASTVNYTAGAVVANSAIVKVSQTSTTAMSIFSLATTHVVADVTGYYSKPVSVGSLECVAANDASTTVPASTLLQSVTAPVCDAGYSKTATSCSFYGNQMVLRKTETSPIGNGSVSSCVYDNPAASAQTVFITSTCCRIPGR